MVLGEVVSVEGKLHFAGGGQFQVRAEFEEVGSANANCARELIESSFDIL